MDGRRSEDSSSVHRTRLTGWLVRRPCALSRCRDRWPCRGRRGQRPADGAPGWLRQHDHRGRARPLIDAVPELTAVIEDEAEVNRLRLFRRLRAELTAVPTLLLLEDVHWADEATLEILRFLGRRIDSMPLLVLATFREDEVVGSHPLTVVLGDLATTPGVQRTTCATGWTRSGARSSAWSMPQRGGGRHGAPRGARPGSRRDLPGRRRGMTNAVDR
jgi:hypothetical protein